jgi:hypothetical protein
LSQCTLSEATKQMCFQYDIGGWLEMGGRSKLTVRDMSDEFCFSSYPLNLTPSPDVIDMAPINSLTQGWRTLYRSRAHIVDFFDEILRRFHGNFEQNHYY